MTVNDLLDNLNRIVKMDEKFGELELVYSQDDEGNAFHLVKFTPTVGCLDDINDFNETAINPTHVCIN